MSKIESFEYFLKGLVGWFCDFYTIDNADFNDHPQNNLSKLKVIKLHFFASSTSTDMLDLFDDFHAMPYGHVESEIYRSLSKLQFAEVTNTKLVITDIKSFNEVSVGQSEVVDNSISTLKELNSQLISFSPFDLVELSHKWFSWRYNFEIAKKDGSFSRPISKELIKKEEKYYSLF
ncbi:MAG TPA: DUF4065 domain-containing protein [Candidatus Sphingobacterium stercorigallinarum]|nr:DUF4065 domain-containing protein [Candidatus Sphingobacterium stercorigallinarum]